MGSAVERKARVQLAQTGKAVYNEVLTSVDFWLGLAAGLAVGLGAQLHPGFMRGVVAVILTDVVLDAGILAVVLGSLAILFTFFEDSFRLVLESVSGGIPAAMRPYKIVAAVAGGASAIGITVATLWPVLPHSLRAASVGLITFGTVWALVGTYQLVGLTIFFGSERSKHLSGVEKAKELLQRRQEQRRRTA